ncbi:A24 family peptidase [Castellaniella sp.]|uniref:prepilin peptidase n=1 Tax=Castellaniella sp. TaxID=1955812 RepID=UPI002AFFBEA4|nr:A24 family peptidase [Castellaniella sp.]
MIDPWTPWPVSLTTVLLAALGLSVLLCLVLVRLAWCLPRRLDPDLPAVPTKLHRHLRLIFCVLAPLLALVCGWRFGATGAALAAVFLVCILLALAWIDAETSFLPDWLTLPLLGTGLLASAWGVFATFMDALIGAAVAYLALWCLCQVFLWLRGVQAMGGGDLKLLAALGAWLGWMALPRILLIAATVALVVALLRRAAGQLAAGQAFAFGPYLAGAGIMVLLGG